VERDLTPKAKEQKSRGVSIDQLKMVHNGLPEASSAFRQEWMQLALDCMQRFDGLLHSSHSSNLEELLEKPRQEVDGAQLNSLESLAPDLASPLMASRFWRWSHERINWSELQSKHRDPDLASIVIPVYGDPQELDSCLEALRAARTNRNWEVIAVMNDESDQNLEVITKHSRSDSRIRAIWPGENTQFALGCNLGFSACEGQWVILLNNDCRVTDWWLDGLVEPLQDSAVAASQPRLLKEDGTIQCLGVVFHEGQVLGYPLYQGLPGTLICTQREHRLQALTGACLAVRANDFAKVRGLDCRYLNSQEDIDLCLRLLQLPDRLYCLSTGSSKVVHCAGRAPGRFGHSGWSRHQFVRRWASRICSDDNKVYAKDGMEIEAFLVDKDHFEKDGIGAGRAKLKPQEFI
jgi:GT2 family glycosyltransferase